ncbi:dTDP-4-dehydrorhamnose 3,5-epimerase family protein [Methylomagnum ishizawai]|uniref:dTDP-4-dehydrorhamnose 3,5-epimerase family protein n=1 Tax=Methylomagnum ishizawai TaxID=1760988 RepID=UPI001C340938|nr:dTDP-4-dehydrorhamnose 3,5-epimerase family protein [Methylomagnum ishizawai]BBL74474.1 dTDP-4-dehydrorhamnose 3,5-epimerase [Methylomagnum ishizawai]
MNAAPSDPAGLFEARATVLPGCLELRPRIVGDGRGRFVKVFHAEAFAALGLETVYPEEYYSVSKAGVIRGLHFQIPPMDHAKLVYCVAGRIQDAALDIRRGSPTYGRSLTLELSAELGNMLYLPSGLAHGFCVLGETAVVVYKTSRPYSPAHDSGLRWDSAGIPWHTAEPILSERDQGHPPLAGYASPFVFIPP